MGCGVPAGKVALLLKSLYGLKQSGFIWWSTLSEILEKNHFCQCDAEPCCWIYNRAGCRISLILHVDDGLIFSNDFNAALKVFSRINADLKHTINEKPADWYLGMRLGQEIDETNSKLNACTLSQEAYIKAICLSNGISDDVSHAPVRTPCTDIKLSRAMSPDEPDSAMLVKQRKYMANVGALLFLTRSLHFSSRFLCCWSTWNICENPR